MRVPVAILSVLVLAAASPAMGEVYRWTDAQGVLHFTQNLEQVPREHRAAARERAAGEATGPASADRLQTFEASAVAPAAPASAFRTRTLRIPFERQGTLMRVHATLNDTVQVPFFVDTGASGISLPESVAGRLGLLHGEGLGSTLVRTANGLVSRSLVRLDSVEVGGARVEGLEATVNPSMEVGLLGGTFFNNFIYRVDAAEKVITLQENEGIRGGIGAEQWRERFLTLREPIARLSAHLDEAEIARESRRKELEGRLAGLERALEQLELEANRAGVPAGWRE